MKKSSSGQNSGARSGRAGSRQGFRSREDKPARAVARPSPKSPAKAAGKAPRPAPAVRSEKPAARAQTRPAADAPRQPTRAQAKAAAQDVLATGVQTLVVEPDEADMRVDRFLVARFPQLAFTHIQRIVRKGELRVDGKRAQPSDRLAAGQKVRIPPLKLDQPRPVSRSAAKDQGDREFLKSITLYEDKDVLIINKPMGLAVQGGSGTTRHVDGLLECMRDAEGQKPRLVHRLDKDTAGCLVIAKTRFAASTMAKSFRSRTTRKIYWALVAGVPRVRQGRVSTYLAKEGEEGDARMKVARHGDEGASHALTYYAVIDTAAQKLAWLSLKPVTGRTHQLRAHTAHIGHPIVGDPKYFDIENWELPGGIQNKLHLLARRIVIAHPRTGKPIDVTAPLPPHMQQSFNLLGFDTSQYDPIVEAPEE
ncbi:RluA family pseudouridine synthase [Microvirga makkahensis]|uniref:Ribosomal large subunit pseudouridine synthase D n=1 Tax=Microvirga makkahensis TaxID=1128670 RepID=A0A7X3SM89_9HYPH|nr:RluA family pseudouridine synthase [Microvirga makkahensis]MXQ09873.1 RluA family pseudouridine synthase [Microvirga makkahensis]